MAKTATYTGSADIREVAAKDVEGLMEDHRMTRFPRKTPVEVSDELAQALQDQRFAGQFEINEASNTESSEDEGSEPMTDQNEPTPMADQVGDAVTAPPTGRASRASTRTR